MSTLRGYVRSVDIQLVFCLFDDLWLFSTHCHNLGISTTLVYPIRLLPQLD